MPHTQLPKMRWGSLAVKLFWLFIAPTAGVLGDEGEFQATHGQDEAVLFQKSHKAAGFESGGIVPPTHTASISSIDDGPNGSIADDSNDSTAKLSSSWVRRRRGNCDWAWFTKTKYTRVSDVSAGNPIYIGGDSLPERVQGAFWLKNDWGDALISLGAPEGKLGDGECSNGELHKEKNGWCTSVSTVGGGSGQGAGWTFQQIATTGNGIKAGLFPFTPLDQIYTGCSVKWDFCLDSKAEPTYIDMTPIPTNFCVNMMDALSGTYADYTGVQNGSHVWAITTTAVSLFPLCDGVPGACFGMIQVMDKNGQKIQPAWDEFAKQNKKIVYYKRPS